MLNDGKHYVRSDCKQGFQYDEKLALLLRKRIKNKVKWHYEDVKLDEIQISIELNLILLTCFNICKIKQVLHFKLCKRFISNNSDRACFQELISYQTVS